MIEQARVALTPAEIASFAQKLDAWSRNLTPHEVAFLHQMLADAADAANEDPSGHANFGFAADDEDDVEGHTMGLSPLYSSIAGYAEGVTRDQEELVTFSELGRQ